MTKEEAKKIRKCNGLGYSTVEFIQALQILEPNPPTNNSKLLNINPKEETHKTE